MGSIARSISFSVLLKNDKRFTRLRFPFKQINVSSTLLFFLNRIAKVCLCVLQCPTHPGTCSCRAIMARTGRWRFPGALQTKATASSEST